jgi:hypothetical protein
VTPPASAAGILALAVLALGTSGRQDVRVEDERYPCTARTDVLRFFQVDTDEVDVGAARAALSELAAVIDYGPRVAESRPGHAFVVVRAPREASPKALAKALRKTGGKAHELECLAFEGRTNAETDIHVAGLTLNSHDFVLGLSGDIAWFDSAGGWTQFYGTPRKLDADDIARRYETLYAPYGGGLLGGLARERFTWTLETVPGEREVARLLKAVRKLDGVVEATLLEDALTLTIVLDALETAGTSGPLHDPGPDDRDPDGRLPPRVVWDSGPLHALLVDAGALAADEPGER